MKVTCIQQIELTSNCNLACKYCVHPNMKRAKKDMSKDMLTRALHLAKYCIDHYGQEELNIAGIGESTMHPDFEEMLYYIRNFIGDNTRITMATNGVSLTEAQAEALKENNVHVWVSVHRPEKAGPAIELLKKARVIRGISTDPATASIDWAGQVDWFVSTNVNEECPWLSKGMVAVTSTGDILTCCLDGDGVGTIGTVYDSVHDLETGPYELCGRCHLKVPGYLDRYCIDDVEESLQELTREVNG